MSYTYTSADLFDTLVTGLARTAYIFLAFDASDGLLPLTVRRRSLTINHSPSLPRVKIVSRSVGRSVGRSGFIENDFMHNPEI